jgi:hypothetical protein
MGSPVIRWANFKANDPRQSLPAAMNDCMTNNSAACDKIMGSTTIGAGYCSTDPFKQQTYCACVNNINPCPQKSNAFCSGADAYHPWIWNQPNGKDPSPNTICNNTPTCINNVNTTGSNNVITGITQQCGGVINNITNLIKTNPMLVGIVFVLFIALVIVLLSDTTQPPPADPQFFDPNLPPDNYMI